MDISNLATIIFTLSTIAILSLDLGLNYNQNEIAVYQHPIFQILAILSGIYLNVTSIRQGTIIFTIWIMLKYFKIKQLDHKLE